MPVFAYTYSVLLCIRVVLSSLVLVFLHDWIKNAAKLIFSFLSLFPRPFSHRCIQDKEHPAINKPPTSLYLSPLLCPTSKQRCVGGERLL